MSKGDSGFVLLYRKIMDWGWYQNPNTARLFIHCILKANYTEKEWQGIKIPAGSFVTSYAHLAQELKITSDKIRTALNHLKLTHEITVKKTSQYSIITVTNYNLYQQNPTQNPKQIPSDSQTNPKQIPTTNKRKKGIKEQYYSKEEIFKELKEKYEKEGHL